MVDTVSGGSEYALTPVDSAKDWAAMHALRRAELFARGPDLVYDENHPSNRQPGNTPLLLRFRGRVVGTVRLDLFGDGTACMRLVAIERAEQGKGHGRELARLFERLARDNGASRIVVNAHRDSIGYYDRLGFVREHWDEPSGERVGVAVGCVPMTKIISDSS